MSTISIQHPGPRGPAADVSGTSAGPVRLTRRGRLVMFVAGLALVLGAFVAYGSQVVATDDPGTQVPATTVTVQPGQTLWDIASGANPGGDIRATVKQIADLNSLPSSGGLRIGERIAVPIY